MNKQRRTNSIRKTEVTVLELVHLYFYYFHAWIPQNKCQESLFKAIKKYQFLSIILILSCFPFPMVATYFDAPIEIFTTFYSCVLSLLALHGLLSSIAFLFLSPNTPNVIIRRFKNVLNSNPSIGSYDLKNKHRINNIYYLERVRLQKIYELEKMWIKLYLKDIELDEIIEKIERNMSNRKPSSRDIEVALRETINNPYIINSLVIVLTVLLTIALSPLSESITSINFFDVLKNLLFIGLYSWMLILTLVLSIKALFFLTIDISIEYTSKDKQVILWRYELLIDMLARHEKVEITKPKI